MNEKRLNLGIENKEVTCGNNGKKRRLRSTAAKHVGFPCSFCGSYTSNLENYYSSLATVLITRFIELLDSANGTEYFQAVLDCIYRVFGSTNPIMRKEMEAAGYIGEFDERQIAA